MPDRKPGCDHIEIHYWNAKTESLPWKGGEVYSYETKKDFKRGLSKILARIREAGYNAMMINNNSIFTTIIFIDFGRFGQS